MTPRLTLIIVALGLAVSAYEPADRITWWLEVFPIFIAAPILILTYAKNRLTSLTYVLIGVHALILTLGAHYTYAQVPLGFWAQDVFDLSRNHYDRVGHIAQGFVPAIITREILIRYSPLSPGKWLFFLVTCVCLAISAFYEFIEWWVAELAGEDADSFLATQGDVWDTQWDMFLAFSAAMISQLIFGRLHDRQIAELTGVTD